jgi:hypothetical protein
MRGEEAGHPRSEASRRDHRQAEEYDPRDNWRSSSRQTEEYDPRGSVGQRYSKMYRLKRYR